MRFVLALLAVICSSYALKCFEGTSPADGSALSEKTCDGGETTCFSPKALDNNKDAAYGCGDCASADTCETCATDSCNVYKAPTYAHKCATSATETTDCTGLKTAGCYTVIKVDDKAYAGTHTKLKDTYGGCGKCDDATTFNPALTADDLKFCKSCDGAECNKPAEDKKSSALKSSVAGLTLLFALYFSL